MWEWEHCRTHHVSEMFARMEERGQIPMLQVADDAFLCRDDNKSGCRMRKESIVRTVYARGAALRQRTKQKRETNKHRDEEIRGWPESTRRTSTSFGRLRKLLSRFFFDASLAPSRPGAASPPRCAMSVDADMFSVPRMPAPFCVRSLRLFP